MKLFWKKNKEKKDEVTSVNNDRTEKKIQEVNKKEVKSEEYFHFSIFDDFVKEKDIDMQTIEEYEKFVPASLICLWKKYGFGSFMNGYFKLINPDDYAELVEETYSEGDIGTPFLVTAFADVFYFEREFIGLIRYKQGVADIIATIPEEDEDTTIGIETFFEDLKGSLYEKYMEFDKYKKAIEKKGELSFDECFGYTPLLTLGGNDTVDNLEKVKIREHIEIIYALTGMIYY